MNMNNVGEYHVTHRFLAEHVYDWLVVTEADWIPLNFLLCVLRLLQLENVLVEEVLQVLVGVVDTQLFEAILLEILEPKDVEDGDDVLDVLAGGLAADDLVQSGDEPGEQTGVKSLRHRITSVQSL